MIVVAILTISAYPVDFPLLKAINEKHWRLIKKRLNLASLSQKQVPESGRADGDGSGDDERLYSKDWLDFMCMTKMMIMFIKCTITS